MFSALGSSVSPCPLRESPEGTIRVTLSCPKLGTESLGLIHRGKVRVMAEEASGHLRNKRVLRFFFVVVIVVFYECMFAVPTDCIPCGSWSMCITVLMLFSSSLPFISSSPSHLRKSPLPTSCDLLF